MCKPAIACVLVIAGLCVLLLCFLPNWVLTLAGVLLIAVGVVFLLLKMKRGC